MKVKPELEVAVEQAEQPEPARLTSTPAPSVAALTTVSALDAATKPRHRWYFFKEAFSPEVVDMAVVDAGCVPGDSIVDPFCGSGTVPVQAALSGHVGAGVEVNPFLAFVTRTKLSDCRPECLEARAEDAVKAARIGRRSPLAEFSTFSEDGIQSQKQQKWLFNRSVLDAFEGAWSTVSRSGSSANDLVRLCLLGAATDVSNATKDGKGLRYRSDWRARGFNATDFSKAFEERVSAVSEDLRTHPLVESTSRVKVGDARVQAPGEKFRLCVTSPPYLNSFDYTDVYRPELFLGKWITTMDELWALRQQTLRSHVQVKWQDPTENDFGIHYREVKEHLQVSTEGLWNARIPLMVQAYFEDMRRVLRHLRRAARDDATMWIVVSTSAYAGVEIPVDLIIADIATGCGWYLREVSVLRYLSRVAGQQWKELSEKKENNKPHLRESVIILDAAPRRAPIQHAKRKH
jgi:DNA modification methylase